MAPMNSTRTSVHRTHALISPDGYVNSTWPGWERCMVHVLINKAMGADFCQNLIMATKDSELTGTTVATQILFYVIQGKANASIGKEKKTISTGHFIYVPVGSAYVLDSFQAGTQILSFHKVFEFLPGQKIPQFIFGDGSQIKGQPLIDDAAVTIQILLPDQLSFDMAVNILTFQPGGRLPFVETHVMEHGLTFLQGKGLYRLDDRQYDVQKGDTIWMAPYCAQWFEAYAPDPAAYIYYKNVNRPAIVP